MKEEMIQSICEMIPVQIMHFNILRLHYGSNKMVSYHRYYFFIKGGVVTVKI